MLTELCGIKIVKITMSDNYKSFLFRL